MSARIDRPIFILGPHRSGTTLVYKTLHRHPEITAFDRHVRQYRRCLWLAPLARKLLGRNKPLESQRIWDEFVPTDDDRLGAEHATDDIVRHFHHLVRTTVRQRGGSRFVAKYPRLSLRVPWIDAVFPDALFVHVARDWRAVVNSTIKRKVKREHGSGRWFGVRPPGWEAWVDLPHDEAAARTFAAVTHVLERERERYADRWITVRYDEICEAPAEQFAALLRAVGVDPHPKFDERLSRHGFRNFDDKWKTDLDPARVDELRRVDPDLLTRYEF